MPDRNRKCMTWPTSGGDVIFDFGQNEDPTVEVLLGRMSEEIYWKSGNVLVEETKNLIVI